MNQRWLSDPPTHHEIDAVIRQAHRLRARVMKVFLRSLFRGVCRLVRQLVGGAGRLARRTVSNAVQRRRQRAAVSELMRLDDRTLKDLGMHRSHIHALVQGFDASHPGQNAARPAAGDARSAAGPNPPAVATDAEAGRRQVIRGR
jgi:uncharacterized protein YjiS (DUF1127 family)